MKTLAILGVPGAAERQGQVVASSHWGLVITELARRFEQVHLAVPELPEDDPQLDCILPGNVSFTPLPPMVTALQGIFRERAITRIYRQVLGSVDAAFVRGMLIPGAGAIFREGAARGIPVIHWLVGNPMALLRSHRRGNRLRGALGSFFVWNWERQVRTGAARGRGALLCNGQEIADRYPGADTRTVVSTTLTAADIVTGRTDTCLDDPVRILTVAYIRPEKGIEYLLRAMPLLRAGRPVRLVLAGSRDRYPGYQQGLDQIVAANGLQDRVQWTGHVASRQLEQLYSEADIFVLPTLSEGTPRVLLEAQAKGIPVVASRVGGIPSSITHEHNGLLVDAKDPRALAAAIDRVVGNGELRRKIIAQGLDFARGNTLDRFADRVMEIFRELDQGGPSRRRQEA
jgi:glycosyltransferase involved in cell wall biosynthesis